MGYMDLAQGVTLTEFGSSSRARASFQWGGTIAALFLLLMNRTGRRSHMQTNLLVLYLFVSFPTMLFKILRGQFGCWVACLAVGANLFNPKTFPVARFILFVITPAWLANGLREGIAAGVYCLIIGVLVIITEIRAQQPYIGLATTACSSFDTTNSALGYSCNGLNRSCLAFLIFRSKPPFNTVASISTLLASDPSQLSKINSVSETATFETNQMVIVPVNCSCSGKHYQANTTYFVENGDTYFLIANNTFQGLSTCQALQDQHGNISNFGVGTRLLAPLRCACPTKNQTDFGVHYLLSYLVKGADTVYRISKRFGVDTDRTLEANGLSYGAPIIYPCTILLVPLESPPSSSQTTEKPPPPPSSPPPPPPNSSSNKDTKKTWIYVVIGVLAGIALTLIFGMIIFYMFFHISCRKEFDSTIVSSSFEAGEKASNKKLDEESRDFLESISDIAQSLKVYTFEELQAATDDFKPSCWIKGSVYRGKIDDDFVAIKKVCGDVSEEIKLLNKISHSRLIRLLGICFIGGNWYLVYEYVVNGSLSVWINENGGKVLDWAQRIQIALDVATGLNYLHSFTNPPHVHKGIKCSNVLLDTDFRAKVANFALARPAERQEGEFALTSHIVGTKGYMAPEYLENGLVSTKLDVYAFGVLMLEMLSGKEAAALCSEENMLLADVLNPVLNKEDGEESLRHLIDPSMQENYPSVIAILLIRLIENCLKKDPSSRPAMDEIVQSLSRFLNASLTRELSKND